MIEVMEETVTMSHIIRGKSGLYDSALSNGCMRFSRNQSVIFLTLLLAILKLCQANIFINLRIVCVNNHQSG